jgi:hypothetical protein
VRSDPRIAIDPDKIVITLNNYCFRGLVMVHLDSIVGYIRVQQNTKVRFEICLPILTDSCLILRLLSYSYGLEKSSLKVFQLFIIILS